MSKRTCAVDDCDRQADTRDWCSTHYSRWKRTGDPGADIPVVPRHPVHAPGATCAVDGCNRSPKDGSRGWCQAHYLRWKSAGDVRADVPVESRIFHASGVMCAVDGCDAQASAREWCDAHYGRWRTAGDPQAELPLRPRVGRTSVPRALRPSTCLIEGCLGAVEARSWCGKHYERWRKHGDPLHAPEKPTACSVTGCACPPRTRGMCEMHYTRQQRHGNPDVRLYAGLDPVAAEAEFRADMAGRGAVVLGEYRNTKSKIHVRCAQGHDCYPVPGLTRRGRGICPSCRRWDVFYVVTSGEAVKFGITSGDPRPRLSEHVRQGFATVRLLSANLPGGVAKTTEDAILAALVLAGERPVRGREYFDISCLGLVMDIADSWLADCAYPDGEAA